MLEPKIQQLIRRNIESTSETQVKDIKKLISYPYHPDTRYLYLQFEGSGGMFGIVPFAYDNDKEVLEENAFGQPLAETDFEYIGFEYLAFDKQKFENGLIDEMDQFAKEYIFKWFRELFINSGGNTFPIPAILHGHDTIHAYHLQKGIWIDQYDKDFV